MKNQILFKRSLTAMSILATVASTAGVIDYLVKKNESLSQILHAHGLRPLYGKNGFV